MSTLLKVTNLACVIHAKTFGRYAGHDLILCYHSVRDKNKTTRGWLAPSRSVDSQDFEAQMRWLSKAVEVVTLQELMDSPRTRENIRVAVTFDDGYFDNIDVALPILRQHGIPITWFVATDYVENAKLLPWWDLIDLALEQCRKPLKIDIDGFQRSPDPSGVSDRHWLQTNLRQILKSSSPQKRDAITETLREAISHELDIPENSYARKQEIKSALRDGLVELGGHTASHPNVALCESQELIYEITSGKRRLEEISGQPLNWFAYPFGGKGAFSNVSAEAVKQAGFKGACTLLSGTLGKKTNCFMTPRFAVSPRMTMETFKARVLGAPAYEAMEKLRSNFLIRKTRNYGKDFAS